jgi:membrane-associated phospholipid phosphatase
VIGWIKQRLERNSDAGLLLTSSMLLFIAATGLFAALAEDVVTGDALVALDQDITRWFQQHASDDMTRWLRLVTDAHSTGPISAMGLAFALYPLWRKAWAWLLSLLLVLPVAMLMNVLLKQIFHRQRPLFDEPLLTLASYSFPSGHVAAATLLYGVALAVRAFMWVH